MSKTPNIKPEDLPAVGPDESGKFRINWDALAERLGVVQETDVATHQAWVNQAIADNQEAVKTILTNPKKAKASEGFLRGQVMKMSGGKADPKLAGELIAEKLQQIKAAAGEA